MTANVTSSSFRRCPGDVLEIRLKVALVGPTSIEQLEIEVADDRGQIVNSVRDVPKDATAKQVQLPVVVAASKTKTLIIKRTFTLRDFGNNLPFRQGSKLRVHDGVEWTDRVFPVKV